MQIVYWVWLTISIFFAHWLTDIAGLEEYASREKIGFLVLFFVYMVVMILFDIIWNVVV